MKYKSNEGLKYVLELRKGEKDQFPNNGLDFVQNFCEIDNYLNSNVHNYVVAGAATSGAGLLNDHGPNHVATVMDRAFRLLGNKIQDLTGFEIYILLLSIHFHDVGNISGREAHEEKIVEIMKLLHNKLNLDYPIKKIIIQIAMAHSGYVDDMHLDKDTISILEEETYIDGQKVRPALLASILRFADEIADDKTRTNESLFELESIPKENMLFHLYSNSLQIPAIEGDTIKLHYIFNCKYAIYKYQKGTEEVYLYDEILYRLKKCLCELDYCKKYSNGFITINALSVSITVLNNNETKELIKEEFKLRLHGYPNINEYSPELKVVNKSELKYSNGELLKKSIEEESNE